MRIRELGELAGTFNRMTEELQGRFRSMELERDEMQTLIDCMGEAVVALTEDARILTANQAAIDLLAKVNRLREPKPEIKPVGRQRQRSSIRRRSAHGEFAVSQFE